MNNINKKVLIVEDEKALSRILGEKLTEENFEVFKALDGGEGLKIALKEHPDLILLDLLMPRVDGLTMLNNLRNDSWGLNAKVIILTNVSDPNKISQGESPNISGVNGYLMKTSMSLENMVLKIKEILQMK